MSRVHNEPDITVMDAAAPERETGTLRDTAAGIAKNTSIMMFQQVITMTSTVLMTLFVARYLGPVEYGKLYLAVSIAGVFQILVNYGGNYLIAKQVARERERTGIIFINALILRLGFALLSVLAIWTMALILNYPSDVRILLSVYGLGLLLWAAHTSLYACYQGHELLQYTSAGAVVERVFVSVVAIAALLLGAGALAVAIIVFLGTATNVATETWFSRKILHVVPKFEWPIIAEELKAGIPYFLFGICSTIYFRIGTVMLERMAPGQAVGWFGAAFRFFESLNFPFILTVAIYPVLARSWLEISDVHRKTMQRSLEYVIVLGIPVAIGTALYSRDIVGLFFGLPAYEPTAAILQVFSAGLLFLYVDMILGTTLLSSDRQKMLVFVSVAAIPLNIGLNLFLIPYFQQNYQDGGMGAAAATVISEFAIMVSMLSLLPRGVLKGFRALVPLKSAVAGVAMGVAALAARNLNLYWIPAATISSLIYIGGLLALRVFEPSEKRLLREMVIDRGLKRFFRPARAGAVN